MTVLSTCGHYMWLILSKLSLILILCVWCQCFSVQCSYQSILWVCERVFHFPVPGWAGTPSPHNPWPHVNVSETGLIHCAASWKGVRIIQPLHDLECCSDNHVPSVLADLSGSRCQVTSSVFNPGNSLCLCFCLVLLHTHGLLLFVQLGLNVFDSPT